MLSRSATLAILWLVMASQILAAEPATRPAFPAGSANLARSQPVTASSQPLRGELGQISGDAAANAVELPAGRQWIQVDLGRSCEIYAITLRHGMPGESFHDVLVQLCDTPEFNSRTATVFNNDTDNSLRRGAGRDAEYADTAAGRTTDAQGIHARYVRVSSDGNTRDRLNRYAGIEVIGLPPEQARLEPLALKLPKPPYGSFIREPAPAHVDTGRWDGPPLMVPRGTKLLSQDAPVTSSDLEPAVGALAGITDGRKQGEEDLVELKPGLQWVQIDLGQPCAIHAVVLYHNWLSLSSYRWYSCVIVHASNDRAFKAGVRTLFNNDAANGTGLGAGGDRLYVEPLAAGKVIAGKGVTARYVRLYSKGNNLDASNHYMEVEAHGTPGR